MDEDNLKKIIGELTNKLEQLESQLKDLQSQQLETGNNIVTLIQHAETMNNVTDASGMLAQHVTDLEEKLNYYKKNTDELKRIAKNANLYTNQFRDRNKEKLISLLVMEKFFKLSKQKKSSVNFLT